MSDERDVAGGLQNEQGPSEVACGCAAFAQTVRFSVPLINPDNIRAISSSRSRRSR